MNENNEMNNSSEERNGWELGFMELLTHPFFTEEEFEYFCNTRFCGNDSEYSEEAELGFLKEDIDRLIDYGYKIESSPRKYLHLIKPTAKTIEQFEEIKKIYAEMIIALQNANECLDALISHGKEKISEQGNVENSSQLDGFEDTNTPVTKIR